MPPAAGDNPLLCYFRATLINYEFMDRYLLFSRSRRWQRETVDQEHSFRVIYDSQFQVPCSSSSLSSVDEPFYWPWPCVALIKWNSQLGRTTRRRGKQGTSSAGDSLECVFNGKLLPELLRLWGTPPGVSPPVRRGFRWMIMRGRYCLFVGD